MNSLDFSLTVIHGDDYIRAKSGVIDSSQIHRVTLSTVHWIPKNFFVLISESMRQRLGLDFDKTLPPQVLGLVSKDILESPGPYRTCECVYLSTASTHPMRAIANPALAPDLPVDFVLGTMFFRDFDLKWNSSLNRLITPREEEEHKQREARRLAYRNIL